MVSSAHQERFFIIFRKENEIQKLLLLIFELNKKLGQKTMADILQ